MPISACMIEPSGRGTRRSSALSNADFKNSIKRTASWTSRYGTTLLRPGRANCGVVVAGVVAVDFVAAVGAVPSFMGALLCNQSCESCKWRGFDLDFQLSILSRLTRWFRPVIGNIPWCGEGGNALVALREERPLEQPAALVMQKIFIPAIFDERGDDDDDRALRMFCGESKNVLGERDDHETIGRRKNRESGGILAGVAKRSFDVAPPLVVQQFGMFAGLDVDGDDFRGEARGEFERLFGDAAPAVNGNDSDGCIGVIRWFDGHGAGGS